MRIAIFTNNYLPNPYGVSGSVESFRKEFERLGHEVFIFAPSWKGYQDKNPNVFRYPSIDIKLKIKFPLAIPYSQRVDKIIEELKLDIIHAQHPNLTGSAAARWARKKNIPLVFTWHTLYDQYAHFVPFFVPQKLAAWWTIRNGKNYANQADAVITPTPSVVQIIKNWGVTNKNIHSIPTGVEENEFQNPDRDKIREKFGVKDDEILLIVLTRLTAEKNVEFLLECAIEVLKKNQRVKFLICGEGDLEDSLRLRAKKSGFGERIIFTGIIPDEEKRNYYASGDVFVYASKSETQGMILTEAMYAGLPIVAVRATGVRDIVEDGETGFLVSEDKKEFGNAVEKLIRDENLRKKFGEAAKGVAREKYTSSICVQKMLRVYENAIKAKNIA